MGSSCGFIILPRDEFRHPFFNDFWNRAAWIELVSHARGIPSEDLDRGQFRASYREISRWLRTTEDQVRRFLKKLIELGKLVVDRIAGKHAPAIYRVFCFSRYNGEKPNKHAGSVKSTTQPATQSATPKSFTERVFIRERATQNATQAATQGFPVEETRARIQDNAKTTEGDDSSPQNPSLPEPAGPHPSALSDAEIERLTSAVVERFLIPEKSARSVVLLGLLRSRARARIQSPEYFRPIVEETETQPLRPLYAEYLESKLLELRGIAVRASP